MKLFLSATLVISVGTVALPVASVAQARSCETEVYQMQDQIDQWGSVTTSDGYRFSEVHNHQALG